MRVHFNEQKLQELRRYIENLIQEVKRDNHPADDVELAHLVCREIISRANLRLGPYQVCLLPVKPEVVTIIVSEDCVLLNIYIDIEQDDEEGIYGFGLAYNLTAPELSEFGYLFTPLTSDFEGGEWDEEVH